MRMTPISKLLVAVGVAITLSGVVSPAWPEETRCPDNPEGTNRFFENGSASTDRTKLEDLGTQIKDKPYVCILAFFDGVDAPAHSKKLAIRRAMWVRDILAGKGVPLGVLAYELRPTPNEAEKGLVEIILKK